jgi:hypothetical protein
MTRVEAAIFGYNKVVKSDVDLGGHISRSICNSHFLFLFLNPRIASGVYEPNG